MDKNITYFNNSRKSIYCTDKNILLIPNIGIYLHNFHLQNGNYLNIIIRKIKFVFTHISLSYC